MIKALPVLAVFLLAGPALSQTADAPVAPDAVAAPIDGPVPDPLALSTGEEVQPDGPKVGEVYVDSEYGDWDLRCVKSNGEFDPCQLYQLLDDGKDNPVAEINIFPLGGKDQAAAGATVITPLETLLTQQLSLAVDAGAAKKYPFSWCSQIGCFARIGLTDADIAALKRGKTAVVSIVPVAAADQKVNITISLTGFTAAFDAAVAKQPK